MTPLPWICLLIALLPLAGCLPALPAQGEPASGTYRVATDIRYQLSRRDFLLHVPPGYRADAPLPLVVVLHGAFSTGSQTERETGFSALADEGHFLVAYPEGIGLFGFLQHWNAGHCCGRAAAQEVDDVGFVAQVIGMVEKRLAVDRRRIYLAGMSNGGMLAYRFAAERTGELAAVAVVAGAIGSTVEGDPHPWWMPEPRGPLPVLIVHGLADDHVPWQGEGSPARGGGRSYLPGKTAVEFWRREDGCGETPTVSEPVPGGIRRLVWRDCAGGSALEVDLLEGWGHRWPGVFFTGELPVGDSLRNFDGTRRIWDFFRRFRRPSPPEKVKSGRRICAAEREGYN